MRLWNFGVRATCRNVGRADSTQPLSLPIVGAGESRGYAVSLATDLRLIVRGGGEVVVPWDVYLPH